MSGHTVFAQVHVRILFSRKRVLLGLYLPSSTWQAKLLACSRLLTKRRTGQIYTRLSDTNSHLHVLGSRKRNAKFAIFFHLRSSHRILAAAYVQKRTRRYISRENISREKYIPRNIAIPAAAPAKYPKMRPCRGIAAFGNAFPVSALSRESQSARLPCAKVTAPRVFSSRRCAPCASLSSTPPSPNPSSHLSSKADCPAEGGDRRRALAAATLAAAAVVMAGPVMQMPSASVLAAGVPQSTYPGALARASPGKPVADLANVFGARQEERLAQRLSSFEADTGFKVRVLTQSEGSAPGSAIKEFFGLDDNSILIVVDLRGGNILNFNVGKSVSTILPESFWIELGNRYGNKFYVRDAGEDGSVIASLDAITSCISSGNICRAVPGFGRDQFTVCATSAGVGGVMAGAASRTGGKKFNLPWLALFSPLWGIFFGSFGLLPVVTREGWASSDTAIVLAAFSVTAALTWWFVPLRFGPPGTEKSEPDV